MKHHLFTPERWRRRLWLSTESYVTTPLFPSTVQTWDRCCGQQEITEGASLFSDVTMAKPILMLKAAEGAVVWVLPAVVAQFLGGSFLRKLQAATPSVLLLFMLKVNRFISFALQFIANNAGQLHMPSTRKCITNTHLAQSSWQSLPPKMGWRFLWAQDSKAGIFTKFRTLQRYLLASFPVW